MTLLDNNFALISAKASEAAAIACFDFIGKNDEKAADQAAVNAMRQSLNNLPIDGTIVIGEGERDEAPMLYIGEKVGLGADSKIDIALDPLEGTTLCAHAKPDSMSVIAFANQGCFLHAPDVYMEKIAIGAGLPTDIIDLDNSTKINLTNLAKAKKCDVSDLTVLVLKRERHKEMIAKIIESGARVQLIDDGDVAGVIATTNPARKIDMYLGTGGAPEGVLAAAALKTTGGQMMGRLLFDNDIQKERAKKMGILDLSFKYLIEDMAKGDVIFTATGVTKGTMLKGVQKSAGIIKLNSIIMISREKTILNITSQYY
jgi:fructose-1,6-bisphosphatase II / sedoheptulose-1,7-bisphosphatase